MSADYDSVDTITVDGYEVRIYHYKHPDAPEDIGAVWTDHEYFYMYACSGISNKEIAKVIQSIQVVNPTS